MLKNIKFFKKSLKNKKINGKALAKIERNQNGSGNKRSDKTTKM